MSRVTDNWNRLVTSFRATTAFSPLLTIGAIANKPVVVGTPGFDTATVFGGLGNVTTFEVQALESDFPANIAKGTLAVLSASAQGTITRQVLSSVRRDGVIYFELGDVTTKAQ